MQIRPSMTTVSVLVNPVVQATGEPSSDVRVAAAARSWRIDLAQLDAPIGHRQPTLDDLPPWLREEEKPGTEAKPTQDPQAGSTDVEQKGRRGGERRTPRAQPDDGSSNLRSLLTSRQRANGASETGRSFYLFLARIACGKAARRGGDDAATTAPTSPLDRRSGRVRASSHWLGAVPCSKVDRHTHNK